MTFGRHDKSIFFLNFEDSNNLGKDVSGFNRNGVPSAVTHVASLGSKSNVANFTPANDSGIDLTSILNVFNSSQSLSFACWFRVPEIGPSGSVRGIWSASDHTQASQDIIIWVESNTLRFQCRSSSSLFYRLISPASILVDTWHHAAFSSGPSGAKLWLDGVLVSSNASTVTIGNIPTTRCQIGYSVDSTNGREFEFNGHLKDCFLSTVEINDSTVSDIYNNDMYGYEVIHLTGQSNQIGRADIVNGIDNDYSTVTGKVFQWGYNAQARLAATNPLDHVNELTNDMGHWLAMCNELVPLLSYKQGIMLTPCAQGGTAFATNHWNPGNTLYENALIRMNESINYHKWSNLRAIHWLQGETDADNNATATYQSSLQTMYDNLILRANEFSADVKFIATEIKGSSVPENVALINSALASFVSIGTNKHLIPTGDLTIYDTYHFNAQSLREIGQRSSVVLLGGELPTPQIPVTNLFTSMFSNLFRPAFN